MSGELGSAAYRMGAERSWVDSDLEDVGGLFILREWIVEVDRLSADGVLAGIVLLWTSTWRLAHDSRGPAVFLTGMFAEEWLRLDIME